MTFTLFLSLSLLPITFSLYILYKSPNRLVKIGIIATITLTILVEIKDLLIRILEVISHHAFLGEASSSFVNGAAEEFLKATTIITLGNFARLSFREKIILCLILSIIISFYENIYYNFKNIKNTIYYLYLLASENKILIYNQEHFGLIIVGLSQTFRYAVHFTLLTSVIFFIRIRRGFLSITLLILHGTINLSFLIIHGEISDKLTIAFTQTLIFIASVIFCLSLSRFKITKIIIKVFRGNTKFLTIRR